MKRALCCFLLTLKGVANVNAFNFSSSQPPLFELDDLDEFRIGGPPTVEDTHTMGIEDRQVLPLEFHEVGIQNGTEENKQTDNLALQVNQGGEEVDDSNNEGNRISTLGILTVLFTFLQLFFIF
eukprot:TRINITY_DN3830_c0_g2_i11.p4 TRINITY_DN3830_c0_g2~~TRINITY_DN3830_c0_g2_i11.p4  ORF type:complete len:124 (-),score=14.67 TRINITY_DN3830_c0_g2_i11:1080-1451(-)